MLICDILWHNYDKTYHEVGTGYCTLVEDECDTGVFWADSVPEQNQHIGGFWSKQFCWKLWRWYCWYNDNDDDDDIEFGSMCDEKYNSCYWWNAIVTTKVRSSAALFSAFWKI